MADYSRRFSLRAFTAKAHADLDNLVSALWTRERYGRYLAGLWAFRAPLEQALRDEPEVVPIADAVLQDMHQVGAVPVLAAPFTMPNTLSGRLGATYVLAGSALGARLLLTRAEALGLPSDHLRAQTTDRALWPAFCARLEQSEPYVHAEAADAACRTFAFAHRAFAATQAMALGAADA